MFEGEGNFDEKKVKVFSELFSARFDFQYLSNSRHLTINFTSDLDAIFYQLKAAFSLLATFLPIFYQKFTNLQKKILKITI